MAHDYTPFFDLVLDKGATFEHSFNWYGNGKKMAPIEDIYLGYPTRIKVTNHGLPTASPTPIFIEGLEGELENLNTSKTGLIEATWVNENIFEVPLNSVGFDNENEAWESNSGGITYMKPTNLDGFDVEMLFFKKWQDKEPLLRVATDTLEPEIITNSNDGSISIVIPASVTDTLVFSKAVWFLNAYNANTKVRCAQGSLTHGLNAYTR